MAEQTKPLAGASSLAGSHDSSAEDRRLVTVFEIARSLATEHDLEAMLPRFLISLVDTLEVVQKGLLLLYDPHADRLMVKAARGYDLAALQSLRIAPGEAICGRVFQTGQAELISSPEAIAAADATMDSANQELIAVASMGQSRAQSAAYLPLVTSQSKEGILILENTRQPEALTTLHMSFLEAIADLIAPTIGNFRLRKELQAAQALTEANRLKAELLSTLAHELRTPLTSIKGYSTALLMEEAVFNPQTQREFLQIIDEECDILQDLIQDLLESSIIDAGLLRLEPEPVVLPHLVKDITNEMAHRHSEYRFLIDFPRPFPIVIADPDRIAQVLRNLLDNAVKYSMKGGLVIIRGETAEREVIISVADQGVGIAPEHMHRLFEKFFRIESGLGRHVVGSGLGLPICRTIVESHGGRIWAESKVGQGSSLYFTLPLEN